MSTRNLTIVISDGETKVAQYGQSDGYPEGQGETVLEFLQSNDLKKFKEILKEVVFINPEKDEDFKGKPEFDAETASKVLQLIYDRKATGLYDSSEFAKNSLFCEWAYVVDLDKGVLEVYRGYNREPLTKDDRFYNEEVQGKDYYPIKIVKSYSLEKLPEVEQFIKDLKPDKSKNQELSL